MSTTRAVWLFVLGLTAIRLILVGTSDLSGDEAYYWMWSERLAPAYFSKGPGVALAIRASTAIFGDTEFGVRFWSPILGAGTSLILYYFTRRLFNEAAGVWAVIALNVTPIFNIGNLVMTIDPLSILFWTAAMFTFWLALERSPAFSWHWPLTGLLIGLGFLCKYTNALELISIALVLALVPRFRREFTRPGFYSLLGTFVLCTIPPIIWNAQHAWITLIHLRTRGGLDASPGLHLLELLTFLAQHFATYSPVLFLALVWAVIASWRRAQDQFRLLYLFWFGLPVFTLYFLLSFNHASAPNWDGLAFLSLGPLAIFFWQERMAEHDGLRRWAAGGLLLGLLTSVIAVLALNTDLIRGAILSFRHRDPTDRVRGWKTAVAAVERLRDDLESQHGRLFLIADARDRASEISFYLRNKRNEGPGHPPVYVVESQDLDSQFSFWPRYDQFIDPPAGRMQSRDEVYTEESGINPFVDRSALYIQESSKTQPLHNIRAGFQSTERVATIEVHRRHRIVRSLQVYLCRNYRTLPL
jgi:4-amino-4-deoxy-L-arabinose transferase-like glycosyltransferase